MKGFSANMYHITPLVSTLLVVTMFTGICEATEKAVVTSKELQAALESAMPGDIINVSGGTYNGPFTASTSGTQASSITLQTNAPDIKITGSGSGVGLTISGNFWTVKNLPISDFDTGVLLSGSGIVLESLAVTNVDTGVDVQGQGNSIKNCAVEANVIGIHVGASNTELESNSVTGSDTAILADHGTCCGNLLWNVASGKLKVDGVRYQSDGNVVVEGTTHGQRKKPSTSSYSFWSSIGNFFSSIFG